MMCGRIYGQVGLLDLGRRKASSVEIEAWILIDS